MLSFVGAANLLTLCTLEYNAEGTMFYSM